MVEGGGYEMDKIDFVIIYVVCVIFFVVFMFVIGFLFFVLIEYKGIGDFGIIVGGGMVVVLIVSLIVLFVFLFFLGVLKSCGVGDVFI